MPARSSKSASPQIEQMLKSFGADFSLVSPVQPSQVDLKRSRILNTRNEPLNESTKAKYMAALERGDVFPPVILFKANNGRAAKYSVADGVHRIAACLAMGLTFDAYVIDPATPSSTIMMIAYRANKLNGLENTEEECISHAIYAADNGVARSEAAALNGIKLSKLTYHLNVRAADNRAVEARIDTKVWDALHLTARASLNRLNTKQVFKKAALLAHDANMSVKAVDTLVVELNNMKDPAKEGKYLDAKRKELKEDIDATAGGLTTGGKGVPKTPKQQLAWVRRYTMTLPEPSTVVGLYQGPECEEAAADFGKLARQFAALEKVLLDKALVDA